MYVLLGSEVEALHGLQLSTGFMPMPKDYFESFDEAKATARIPQQKGRISAVQNVAATHCKFVFFSNSLSFPFNTESIPSI